MSNKLQWESIPMMGWTKHTATTPGGRQYVIEKEDDNFFVLFIDDVEYSHAGTVRGAKTLAQENYESRS